MIVFVSTASHGYTHLPAEAYVPELVRRSYDWLFRQRRLPIATYVLADFDRLSFWGLEIAAAVHRQLVAAGCRVLNDPARALLRLALLRRLHREGVNRFGAWAAADADAVDRFPVFVRTERAHRGILGDLVEDRDALRRRIAALVERGYPISDLIVVEYRAEPVRPGLYRKPSVYRIADRFVAVPSVHEAGWSVKGGTSRIATDAEYADDLARIRDNPFAGIARRGFEIAAIDYGRIDIGVVDGEPQLYEINTNPMMPPAIVPHRSPVRTEAFRLSNALYAEAMRAIDTPRGGGRIAITLRSPLPPASSRLGRLRRRLRLAAAMP